MAFFEHTPTSQVDSIPKLVGTENYIEWQATLLDIARANNCHRHVLGTAKEPYRRHVNAGHALFNAIYPANEHAGDAPPTIAQRPAQEGDAQELTDDQQDRWDRWAKNEAKARYLILQSVSPSLRLALQAMWSTHDIYLHLQATYDIKTDAARDYADRQVQELKLPDFPTAQQMLTHLNEFIKLVALASDAGAPFEPWRKISTFLHSLGAGVGDIRGVFAMYPDDSRTWKTLQDVYLRRVDAQRYDPQVLANLANTTQPAVAPQQVKSAPTHNPLPNQPAGGPIRPRPNKQNRHNPDGSLKYCEHCALTGHLIIECRRRASGAPPRIPKHARVPLGNHHGFPQQSQPPPNWPHPQQAHNPWPQQHQQYHPNWQQNTHNAPPNHWSPPHTVQYMSQHPNQPLAIEPNHNNPQDLDDQDVPQQILVLQAPPLLPEAVAAGSINLTTYPADGHITFLIDSGASTCVVNDLAYLTDPVSIPPLSFQTAGKSATLVASAKGSITVANASGVSIIVPDVYYIPTARMNLLSFMRLKRHGWHYDFDSMFLTKSGLTFTMIDSDALLMTRLPLAINARIATARPRTLTNHPLPTQPASPMRSAQIPSASYIHPPNITPMHSEHRRLGHIGVARLTRLATEGQLRYPLSVICNDPFKVTDCNDCGLTSMSKPSPSNTAPIGSPNGEIISFDFTGPFIASPAGHRYALCTIGTFSRIRTVELTSTRQATELVPLLEKTLAIYTNQANIPVRGWRSDGAKEFGGDKTAAFMARHGHDHQMSAPYTPEHNAHAERNIGALKRLAVPIISSTALPANFWPYALRHACNILNQTTLVPYYQKTPWEMITGRTPHLDRHFEFGAIIMAFVHPNARDPKGSFVFARARLARYLGQDTSSPGALVRYEDTGVVARVRDVRATTGLPINTAIAPTANKATLSAQAQSQLHGTIPSSAEITAPASRRAVWEQPVPQQRRSNRLGGIPAGTQRLFTLSCGPVDDLLSDLARTDVPDDELLALTALEHTDPRTFRAALSSPNADLWRKAIAAEYANITSKGTWTESIVPTTTKPIATIWVFKTKRNDKGDPIKYKARLCARDCFPRPGLEATDVYAPVARAESLRTLLAIAHARHWQVQAADVEGAYLNGTLTEEVYVKFPPGYTPANPNTTGLRLHKALYGLKQAGRAWWNTLTTVLQTLGFHRTQSDWGMYRLPGPNNTTIAMMLVYVDDLVIAAPTDDQIDVILRQLESNWPITRLGAISNILGLSISRTHNGFHITQPAYIQQAADKYLLVDTIPIDSPLPKHHLPAQTPEDHDPNILTAYRSIIGECWWLARMSRPDIEYATGALSRRVKHATTADLALAKRILTYIYHTRTLALRIGGPNITLSLFTDADWAGDLNTGRSTSGTLIRMGNSPILWASKRQPFPASSTMIAEYVAASDAIADLTWLTNLLSEMGEKIGTTTMYIDNKTTIQVAKNPFAHDRTRHIPLKYHLLRHAVEHKRVKLEYVASKDQAADSLTKPLEGIVLTRSLAHLGLTNV